MWHRKSQYTYGKGRYDNIQTVKTLLINKDKNSAAGFTVFIEHHNKVRNRDLGFTSVR